MTRRFFKIFAYDMHRKLTDNGISFAQLDNHPWEIFTKKGYKQQDVQSTLIMSVDLGLVKFPKFIVKKLFKKFFMGYSVYTFEYAENKN